MANLANFAYDPVNYEYMRTLNVIDLFLGKVIFFLHISIFITQHTWCIPLNNLIMTYITLDCLDESDEKLVEFGIGGLCNICLGKYTYPKWEFSTTVFVSSCFVQ